MVLLLSTDTIAQMVQAISWTLVHSLWLGVLLSIAAAIIIFATRHTKPQVRYNLLAAALLAFMLGVAISFKIQVTKANQIIDVSPLRQSGQTLITEARLRDIKLENKISIAGNVVAFINTNAALIAAAWLLVIALQFIQLTAGLYGIYRLKSSHVFSVGAHWNERLIALSKTLQVNKQVQLLQSALVKMPAVIGYFKPVILFPAGMLASLPADEVEAVLLHELAHIRRKDFLVNLVQQLMEIIFFFNPAVLWVSALIKSERENCCDEIAVQQTCNKQNYIKALLSFETFNLPQAPVLANGFNGEKNHLLNRIKRIIYNNNKTLNNMEKRFLAAGVIVTSVLIFSFTANNAQQKPLQKTNHIQLNTAAATKQNIAGDGTQTDTLPAPALAEDKPVNGTINSTQHGKRYKMVTDNNQVKELYIDGKKVPAEKLGSYKTVTDKLLAETKLELEQSQKEMAESAKEMEQSKKEMEESKLEMAQSQKELAESAKELEQSKKEMAEASGQIVLEQKQAKKEMEQSKLELVQSKKEIALAKIELEKSAKEMKEDSRRAKLDMEQSSRDMVQAKKDMEQAAKDEAQAKKDEEQSRLLQERIVSDFINEHIIKDKSELSSYQLNNDELIVNDTKQPEDVFKRFKAKYVKSKQFTMMYNQ